MPDPMRHALERILTAAPVIAILTVDDVRDSAAAASALVAGGLSVIEVVLQTPAALEAIAAIRAVDGAIVGAGTIRDASQLAAARRAGAHFAASPGSTATFVRLAGDFGLSLLPSVASAAEVICRLEFGLHNFKSFPAEAAGAAAILISFAGRFPDVRFCATGGVTAANAGDFLRLPNLSCVGGSWVCPPDALRSRDRGRVTPMARDAAALSVQ